MNSIFVCNVGDEYCVIDDEEPLVAPSMNFGERCQDDEECDSDECCGEHMTCTDEADDCTDNEAPLVPPSMPHFRSANPQVPKPYSCGTNKKLTPVQRKAFQYLKQVSMSNDDEDIVDPTQLDSHSADGTDAQDRLSKSRGITNQDAPLVAPAWHEYYNSHSTGKKRQATARSDKRSPVQNQDGDAPLKPLEWNYGRR